jgi:hypothetical protein
MSGIHVRDNTKLILLSATSPGRLLKENLILGWIQEKLQTDTKKILY